MVRCGVVLPLQMVDGAVWCSAAVADGGRCGVVLLLQMASGSSGVV